MSEMAEAIRQLISEKGYSEDSVRQTIERALKAAYKRTYGTDENAIVKFNDDMSDVSIYSRKVIIDGVYDPVKEIELVKIKKEIDRVTDYYDTVRIYQFPLDGMFVITELKQKKWKKCQMKGGNSTLPARTGVVKKSTGGIHNIPNQKK